MAAFQVPSNPLEVSPWANHQGSLPPEVDIEGNIEYKLKLIATAPDRFEHLVTQLKWRLSEGHGSAIYEIGVADDGSFVGLSPDDMEVSLNTLQRMAEFLKADVTILRKVSVESTQHFHHDQDQESRESNDDDTIDPHDNNATMPLAARRVFTTSGSPRTEPEYLVVEAKVTSRLADEHHFLEIRVALVGGPDAGKSTLLGRLAHGIADNGRGKARLNLLRHRHEISSGRTSSISHEVMGFTSKGETVNYSTTNISSWQEVCESSAKVVTLLDTCGHPRFLKTTISGLTGHSPDYACLVVDSRIGGVSEMTKEHLALATALGLATFVVVTKMDVATREQLRATVTALMALIRTTGSSCLPSVQNATPAASAAVRLSSTTTTINSEASVLKFLPVIVHNEKDLESIVKRFSDTVTIEENRTVAIPVLLLSSVTGENVNLLEKFLYLLPKPPLADGVEGDSQEPACYQIEEIYNIPDIGTVVGGFLHSGKIEVHKNTFNADTAAIHSANNGELGGGSENEKLFKQHMRLYLGPVDRDGGFIPVCVKSIHRQRMSMRSIDSGQTATLAIEGPGLSNVRVRRGMVVLESDTDPRGTCCQKFEAVIQVLSHEGVFGTGFQGMIHCGSVHQNARVIKIELLPGPDNDDIVGVEDDAINDLESRPRSRASTRGGRESVMSQRSNSSSSDYESGTGSSVPVSRSGSFRRGSMGDFATGDDHHGSAASDDHRSPQLTRPLNNSRSSSHAQGMIPVSTMRTFRRLSIRNSSSCSTTDPATLVAPTLTQEEGNTSVVAHVANSSTTSEAKTNVEKEEDDDENLSSSMSSVELSAGSRARVVFRFCHDVAFMREGTTVLFRHDRTKCVGKVLRML